MLITQHHKKAKDVMGEPGSACSLAESQGKGRRSGKGTTGRDDDMGKCCQVLLMRQEEVGRSWRQEPGRGTRSDNV